MNLTFEFLNEMINCYLTNRSYPVKSSGDAVYIIKGFL